jgi:ABC-type nitrate/sulfonate/bicarbonate transport system substrate-binding protein
MEKLVAILMTLCFFIVPLNGYGEEIKVMMPWYPSADYIPYVVALEKGFYKKYGLDVTIVPGGIGGTPEVIRMVTAGQVQFGSTGASHTMAAIEKGANVIVVMSLFEKATQGIYYKKSRVRVPSDLAGKNILMAPKTTRAITAKLFMLKNGLDGKMGEVVSNNLGRNVEIDLFLTGKIDALPSALLETKALFQEVLGDDMGFFHAGDHGVNIISIVLITNPDLIAKNPTLVQKFVSATREGYYYSFKHVDESVGFMEKRYPETIPMKYRISWPEAERYARERKSDPIGLTNLKNWEGMKEELISIKFINGTVDPKKCFTNRFIKNDFRGK